MKKEELYEENRKELHDLISSEKNLSQRKFADDYYGCITGGHDSTSGDIDSHFERFKKLISPKADSRSPERISSYLRFFKESYSKDGIHTPYDRDAAWAMYVELDSRIATQELKDGDLKTALSSLASLFQSHRNISKQYGHRCRRYYEETSTVLNQVLRPFLSKYHELIEAGSEIEPKAFKNELKDVQADLRKLKSTLYEISK